MYAVSMGNQPSTKLKSDFINFKVAHGTVYVK